MLRQFRETGPVVLVPLAWIFAVTAYLRLLEPRTVLIALLVMAFLLFAFAVLSWGDMVDHPVLRAWLTVFVVGLGITLAGAYAVATEGNELLLWATVTGWMLVPAGALLYTGRMLPAAEAPSVYTLGGILSIVAAAVMVDVALTGPISSLLVDVDLTLVAFVVVGVGQTAGIVNAVVQY